MMPMGYNSTRFLSYREIKTEDIDIYEDAFGIYQQFSDVIGVLNQLKPLAGKQLTRRLITKIRKAY